MQPIKITDDAAKAIAEKVSGKDGAIFRFLSERKDQNRGVKLLSDSHFMILIAEILEIAAKSRGLD
mgnify:CR=1 FL=1